MFMICSRSKMSSALMPDNFEPGWHRCASRLAVRAPDRYSPASMHRPEHAGIRVGRPSLRARRCKRRIACRSGAQPWGQPYDSARRVGAFEKRLGLRLFERLPSGYVLTAGGEELAAASRAIDDTVTELERKACGPGSAAFRDRSRDDNRHVDGFGPAAAFWRSSAQRIRESSSKSRFPT